MRSSLLLRLGSLLALTVITTPAWADYKVLIHKVTHQLSDGFTNTYELPPGSGWYVSADLNGELLQPNGFVQVDGDQAAGAIGITLKDARGKIVAEVEDKGLLGNPPINCVSESAVVMFVKAGATDAVGPVHTFADCEQFKTMNVTISPSSFGPGSQLILRFEGHVPAATTGLVLSHTIWGAGLTNLPEARIGQARYDADQLGQNGGGQASVTLDFELIEE